jgi:hypothetical protein
MIPFILAPYCRRQKAWALWSTLVLYGPIFFLESGALCGLFSRFSLRELGSGADVLFLYWGLTGIAVVLAAIVLVCRALERKRAAST